nr:hypothetical protein GCM10025699_06770 [Microbacterium flavescens]
MLPEGATNQFLYTGGLSPVADVLTRAVASDDTVRGFVQSGAEVTIARDATASSPVVAIQVTAESDEVVAEMLSTIVEQAEVTLEELQADQGIPPGDRVTISNISIDEESTVRERSRIVVTLVAGLATLLFALIVASAVDGFAMKRRRRMRASVAEEIDQQVDTEYDDDAGDLSDPSEVPEFLPVANAPRAEDLDEAEEPTDAVVAPDALPEAELTGDPDQQPAASAPTGGKKVRSPSGKRR